LAGVKSLVCAILLFALGLMTMPIYVSAFPPQPPYTHNQLYLHYNMTRDEGWMNSNPNDTNDTGWFVDLGLYFGPPINLSFPLNLEFNDAHYFTADPQLEWVVCVFLSPSPMSNITGTLYYSTYQYVSVVPAKKVAGPYEFSFNVSSDIIDYRWGIRFTISFLPCFGDFRAAHNEIYTEGESNLTIPVLATEPDTDGDGIINSLDPDDDNDGHLDPDDAYPLDPARWANPETAKPVSIWWHALPAATVLAAVALAVLWRLRKGRPRSPL